MRGPTVKGIEDSPSINPTPWDAPDGPQRLYATIPSIVIKQPSKSPIISAQITMDSHSKPVSFGAAVKNIVHIPITTNEICCKKIALTFGKSATLPKTNLPIPEVAERQVTKSLPFLPGNASFTYSTWK